MGDGVRGRGRKSEKGRGRKRGRKGGREREGGRKIASEKLDARTHAHTDTQVILYSVQCHA